MRLGVDVTVRAGAAASALVLVLVLVRAFSVWSWYVLPACVLSAPTV